jgi:hypothetical protein
MLCRRWENGEDWRDPRRGDSSEQNAAGAEPSKVPAHEKMAVHCGGCHVIGMLTRAGKVGRCMRNHEGWDCRGQSGPRLAVGLLPDRQPSMERSWLRDQLHQERRRRLALFSAVRWVDYYIFQPMCPRRRHQSTVSRVSSHLRPPVIVRHPSTTGNFSGVRSGWAPQRTSLGNGRHSGRQLRCSLFSIEEAFVGAFGACVSIL